MALLIAPSVLQKVGVPHVLRRFVATALAGTYYTMDPSGTTVWATKTGVTPGSPLADAFFQAIFMTSLTELENRLMQRGAECSFHQDNDFSPAPVATWIDDEAILAEVERPSCLVEHVRALVVHAQAALALIGISANFDVGKTEVMLIYVDVGKRSRKEKLRWLTSDAIFGH